MTQPEFPRAYLNYLFFDYNMQLVHGQSGALQLVGGPNDWIHLDIPADIEVAQSGYLVTYISNEQYMSVNFDDIKVKHYRGKLLEEQHYYPHGMLINKTVAAGAKPENKYQYQGKLMQNELGMELYDFHARQYDPQIGRFLSPDPLNEFASGYVGMGNDPANLTDPTGMRVTGTANISDDEYQMGSHGLGASWEDYEQGKSKRLNHFFYNDGVAVGIAAGFDGIDNPSMYVGLSLERGFRNVAGLGRVPGFWTKTGGFVDPLSFSKGSAEMRDENGKVTRSQSRFAWGISSSFIPYSELGGGEKSGDGSNWLSNAKTVTGMGMMWATGQRMPFGAGGLYNNDRVAGAMRNAHRVNQARNFFYDKYKGASSLTGASVTGFKGSFGLSGLLRAGIDPVEQFIGSYSININAISGGMLQYTLTNNTSFTSFFYGIAPSWNSGPMGNFHQTYIFTESIDLNRLK